jgi:hypothetical protein
MVKKKTRKVHTMTEQNIKTSRKQNPLIKCLTECPRCHKEGIEALCGFYTGHTSAHRCDRCNYTW